MTRYTIRIAGRNSWTAQPGYKHTSSLGGGRLQPFQSRLDSPFSSSGQSVLKRAGRPRGNVCRPFQDTRRQFRSLWSNRSSDFALGFPLTCMLGVVWAFFLAFVGN